MNTPSIYIFEAGGSKTDLLIYTNQKTSIHSFSGFNPNRLDSNFISELNKLNIPLDAKIYFYGSGIANKINQQKTSELFPNHTITVNSDILGAARATLNNNSGIVCILGTGGIAAFYDGHKIIEKKGGYGYLIDDIGGGLELGKLIISKWLNNDYNKNTNIKIESYFNCNKSDFTSLFYKTKNLHHISELCKIIPDLAKQDKNVNQSILNYFSLFFERHLISLCKTHNIYQINLVGSIAHYYIDWIKEAGLKFDIKINSPISKPIENLLNYHLSQK